MKKTIYLLMLVLALGAASCHRNSNANLANCAAALVDHGKLAFYDAKSQKATVFEKETDSVINLVFDGQNRLYYTAANNKNLSLKMLDLNASNPEPKHCADWNTTVDLAYDYMIDRVHELYIDEAYENIFFYRLDTNLGFVSPLLYEIKKGKVREVGDDETFSIRYDYPNCNTSHFFTENQLLYYVTPQGKSCLNDKIDIVKYFPEKDEREDLEYMPVAISPDGKYMAYTAVVYWGEGWGYHCVSKLDGSMQTLLPNSNFGDYTPKWLDNGTLMYIEKVPIPEDDPQYIPNEYNKRICIAVFDPKKNTSTVVSQGDAFALRPAPMPERKEMQQKDLDGCDAAIFDHGKVTFYNSASNEFIPYVADDDSIVNGTFVDEYAFYYTVKIGDELFLKQVYLGEYVSPLMLTDWELTLDECVSETYGKVSPLMYVKAFERVGINHNFSWDFYDFADIKFYDFNSKRKLNGWSEEEDVETDVYDDEFMQLQHDFEHFFASDGNFYYQDGDREICISDKIHFQDYVSDPEYFSGTEFDFRSIDPTRRLVAYVTYIEFGDLAHGPLCVASLDGQMQQAFKDTDAADLTFGWLNNGSLLYVGAEPRPTNDPDYDAEWNNTRPCVIMVRPDGTSSVFAHSPYFVVKSGQ